MKAEELYLKLLNLGEERLRKELNKLENHPLFYTLPNVPKVTYFFSEEMIQDAIYKETYFLKHIIEFDLMEKINKTYLKLLDVSFKEKYFFLGCTLDVAIIEFKNRTIGDVNPILGVSEKDIYSSILDDYILTYNDYFVNAPLIFDDLEKFKSHYCDREELTYLYYLLYSRGSYYHNNKSIWHTEYLKIIEYLKQKIKSLENPTTETQQPTVELIEEPINIELSQKLVLLKKLGVIDFLLNKEEINHNATKVGKILCRLIAEQPISQSKTSTIKRYTRNICSENAPRNPMNSETHTNYVDAILLNILK